MLRDLGCDLAQGYAISRPLSAQEACAVDCRPAQWTTGRRADPSPRSRIVCARCDRHAATPDEADAAVRRLLWPAACRHRSRGIGASTRLPDSPTTTTLSNAIEAEDRKADSAHHAQRIRRTSRAAWREHRVGLEPRRRIGVLPALLRPEQPRPGRARAAAPQVRRWVAMRPGRPFSAQAIHRNYHYDYRDGWQYDAAATAGKQLGERWSVRASVRYDRYHRGSPAAHGAARRIHRGVRYVGLELRCPGHFSPDRGRSAVVSYTWRNGTVTAVTPPDEKSSNTRARSHATRCSAARRL